MEQAIQVFAAIHLLTAGLSHITAPKAWAEFFVDLRERGHRGVFVVAAMSLWFGSIVVAFHNVWLGIPLLLTLLGWAQVLKGFVYFLFPGWGLRRLRMVTLERARIFIYPGVLLTMIAGLLIYHLATTWS